MNDQLQSDMRSELEEMESKNLLWNPKTLEGPSGGRANVAGREVIMLCSNNYLGLSNNRILKRAAIAAIKSTVRAPGVCDPSRAAWTST